MNSNLLSRYESKINEWQELIKTNPHKKSEYESEMYEYMSACVPYLEKYIYNDNDDVVINTVFNTSVKKGKQRKSIYMDYLVNVESYKGSDIEMKNVKIKDGVCDCGGQTIFSSEESEDVCTECGKVSFVLGEELTYKEEQESTEKIITYMYKRENHFNEWLLQFQARENTSIPSDLVSSLRAELKKMKVKDVREITQTKVRGLLKKLKMNKYYEHVAYITNLLNGLDPPKMSEALESRLRHMFMQIQEPFDRHCPSERKNFLSYSYVLYKFCELLEEDSFLPCFPLLKSKEKLYNQDVIWRKICNDLRWEFIPTV